MKEKLLMLCHRVPDPSKSGGQIRMYQFLEILSEKYEITLLYLETNHNEEISGSLYEKCHKIEKFGISKWKSCWQAVVGYLFKNQPLQIGFFYSKEMKKWMEKHATEYSTILCMHIRTLQYLYRLDETQLASTKIYMDGIDSITLNFYNSYKTSRGIRKLMNGIEYRKMAAYEVQAYSWLEHSILISERDREYITGELGAKCNPKTIAMYAVDYGYMPEIEKEKRTLAFMGKMDYAPNVDAMIYFVNEVYPDLKERYPDLKLRIIGGNATDKIKKLGEEDGIELCGFVDNPAELLQSATLVIAPMVSGSGLQTKIIQAMQLGCTVVTTPVGADGLTGISEREIVIAKSRDEMVEKMAEYLDEKSDMARREIGQKARAYIEQNYSREKIRKEIIDFFE